MNVDTLREDDFQNDGIFDQTNLDNIFADCRATGTPTRSACSMPPSSRESRITAAPRLTRKSVGYSTGPNDRGVRFY